VQACLCGDFGLSVRSTPAIDVRGERIDGSHSIVGVAHIAVSGVKLRHVQPRDLLKEFRAIFPMLISGTMPRHKGELNALFMEPSAGRLRALQRGKVPSMHKLHSTGILVPVPRHAEAGSAPCSIQASAARRDPSSWVCCDAWSARRLRNRLEFPPRLSEPSETRAVSGHYQNPRHLAPQA
jgi:hypothetical protein